MSFEDIFPWKGIVGILRCPAGSAIKNRDRNRWFMTHRNLRDVSTLLLICAMVKSRVLLGMGDLPPFIRNPYNGYINPYYWVDEFIPYYMEIMGV